MLLEVGHVGRPHGLSGEVVVELLTSVEGRLAPGSALTGDGGQQLTVVSRRPVPGKAGPQGGRWLVRFAGVDDRKASEALSGTVLLAEPLEGAEGLWVHQLIGSEVSGPDGVSRGKVVSVEANPASDLLVLEDGTLVPLRFVVSSAPGEVVVDVPEGLFDL